MDGQTDGWMDGMQHLMQSPTEGLIKNVLLHLKIAVGQMTAKVFSLRDITTTILKGHRTVDLWIPQHNTTCFGHSLKTFFLSEYLRIQ